MDAGGLRACAHPCSPCASRNLSRIVDECQLACKHKLLQVLVLRKSVCSGASQSRSRKARIVVANAAVADNVCAVANTILGVWWLRFRDMGSLVPSSVLSFSSSMPPASLEAQGALLQARAKSISHSHESPGILDAVATKRWRYEDGGTPRETRITSGRSASTSGLAGDRPTGTLGRNAARRSKENMDAAEIESLEVLARRRETSVVDAQNSLSHRQARAKSSPTTYSEIRSSEGLEEIGGRSNAPTRLISQVSGQSTVSKAKRRGLLLRIQPEDSDGGSSGIEAEQSEASYRSQKVHTDASSTNIEQITDAAGKTMPDIDLTSDAADSTIGQNVTIDAVDNFSRLDLNGYLERGSAWEEKSSIEKTRHAPGILYRNSISEAKRRTMRDIQKQLINLNGRKGNGGAFLAGNRGDIVMKKTVVRRDVIQLPDNIEDVLPVDPKKGSAEYLSLYGKLLGASRLQDCVALLESIDKYSVLIMDKVNPYEFYSACKRRRALKEAFRFSRLIRRKSLLNYNMLLSVCAQAQDASAACRVLDMVRNAGLKADCMFYTTLISACAKAGRIDLMFKFLNEMETEGVDANVQTFGAMIDGCARAGDVPKAFGIFKKMLNQNVKPDRVIFNTLITACGRAGAFLRAFEVLADMRDITLDHFSYGALIAACARAGEVERALEVYKRMRSSKVAGTAECYTAAVHACSQKGYLNFALSIYEDMKKDGVLPDEVFFCALIDVAGHAGKLDVAFAIPREMKSIGIKPGQSTYNTLMVVCSNVSDAGSAMHVYEEIKALGLKPTVSTLNALVASLCARRQLGSALTALQELRIAGVTPNKDTYSILLAACEREDQASIALKLYNHSKDDSVQPTLNMCNRILGLCIRRVQCGAPPPHDPRMLNIKTNEDDVVLHHYWASQGMVIYDDLLSAGLLPTLEIICHVLGCMRVSERSSQQILSEDRSTNLLQQCEIPTTISVEDACGLYLPRALTLYVDVTALGVIPKVDYAAAPTSVDMRNFPGYAGEVGVLALLKGLKHRHDVGLYLNSVKLIFAVEVKEAFTAKGGFRRVHVSSRTGQAVKTLLRRLRIKYHGQDSLGEVTISNSSICSWFKVTHTAPQKSVGEAVDTISVSCRGDSLVSVIRSKQRLSHYPFKGVENAPVV